MTREFGPITVDQAAVLIGRSSRTVRRWIADGLLTATKGAQGRAKLYDVRAVYEAERLSRLGSGRRPDDVSQ